MLWNWDKILGYDNIAAIDLDGCVNEEIINFILKYLNLPQNYEWTIKSGSQAGYQIIFKTNRPDISDKRIHIAELGNYQPLDETFGKVEVNAYYPLDNISEDIMPKTKGDKFLPRLINNNSFEKIEFKWKGHIVIPPSVHSSGRQYSFLYNIPKSTPQEIKFELLSELQIIISGRFAQDSSRDGAVAIPDEEDIFINGQCAVIIDCETNGLPIDFNKDYSFIENWPRLLQISWLICGRNYPRGDFAYYKDEKLNLIKRETRNILPKNFSIDSEGELIHGLNNEFLDNLGEELKSILKKFVEDIKKCSLIIGHNLEYDLNIIKSELLRSGMDISFFKEKKTFCTMKNSIDICKIGTVPYKFPSLSELFFACFAKRISVEHNSIFDAFITMKCFNEIGEIEGNKRWDIYFNRIKQKRKEFDNNYKNLSGAEKLRVAIKENEYFPFYNEEALHSIQQGDLLLLKVEERKSLYKKLQSPMMSSAYKRWENIKNTIELVGYSEDFEDF